MMPFIDFDNDFLDTEALLFLAGTSGTAVEDTATGNPLTFATNIAKPLKSLLIPFTPQQEGTGNPSPSNVRNIVPWNGLKVFGGGKNLFNASAVIRRDSFLLNDNGVEQTSSSSGYTLNRTKVKAGAVYTINGTIVKGAETCRLYFYNGDTFVSRTSSINVGAIPYTFTVPQNCDGIAIQYNIITVDFSTIQLEAGSTATTYVPYVPITETDIVFPSPVYGGTLDVVSGVLTVEYVCESKRLSDYWSKTAGETHTEYTLLPFFTDSIKRNSNQKCNVALYAWAGNNGTTHFYASEADGRVYVYLPNGTDETLEIVCVAELATPQEVQLTPAQLTALIGNNTIWSDADGQMTAVYLKKP